MKQLKGCSFYEHLTRHFNSQVYQKAEDGDKAAHYCTVTLRRQLEMKSYDPVAWALNAATLSQYYVTENDFTLSRHCLGKCDSTCFDPQHGQKLFHYHQSM